MRRAIHAALALLILLCLGPATTSSAQSGRRDAIIMLDAARTQINFTLTGFPHTTTGSFKLKRGEIRVAPQTGRATGSIIVDAVSGATGITMRDSHMKDGILEVQRYPEIRFEPRQVEGHPLAQGDFTMQVSGVFGLHGAPHDMTLDVAIRRNGDDFTASAHFTVPYVQWGMKNPSLLFLTVSDVVAIDVSAAGRVIWVPAP